MSSGTLYGLLVVSAIVLIVGVVAHLSSAHQPWHTWFMALGTLGLLGAGAGYYYSKPAGV